MEKGDLVNVDFDGYEAWYQEHLPNGIWGARDYEEYGPFVADNVDDMYVRIEFRNPNKEWDAMTCHIPLQFVSKVKSE